MRKFLCMILVVAVTLCLPACGEKSGAVTLTDKNGNLLATLTQYEFDKTNLENQQLASYLTLALEQGVQGLSEAKGLTGEDAKEELFTGGYTLHTPFDPTVFSALETLGILNPDLALGVAVTDLKGKVLATYGEGALYETAPHSALKPLSVYAPAIEQNVLHYASVFEDSPYKTEGGDWPQNANGQYSYQNVTLAKGVAQSLNTVAVKALKEWGVGASISFLQNSFGMDLSAEQQVYAQKGEEEVLGNLALGSLYQGVTTVDMAGYYQIFATEGKYTPPTAVVKITHANGAVVYEHNAQTKQVISYETAYIMNRILQEVVSPSATGAQARLNNVPVAGKTGTGRYENTYDNWFVGVTPGYSVAVWHGQHKEGNLAPNLFKNAVEQFFHEEKATFPTCSTVETGLYCTATGNLWTSKCFGMVKGYGKAGDGTKVCDECDA